MTESAINLRAERDAVCSSCCGFLGETLLTDSAVILLLAGMLGAGDLFALLTTSLLPLFNGLLIVPMAWLSTRVGARRLNLGSCLLAAGAYFAAASAPLWGPYAVAVLMTSIVAFALLLTGFIASWFPLLDGFLAPQRRAGFFGRMRFCHQATAVAFMLAVSLLIGKAPPIGALQAVLALGAIIFCGRSVFVARLPAGRADAERGLGLRRGLGQVLRNGPMMGFSSYLFLLNLCGCGVIPLTLLMLKRQWRVADNLVVLLSSLALAGMLLGYLAAGRVVRRLGPRGTLLAIHLSFILVSPTLALLHVDGPAGVAVAAAALALDGFMVALASIVASSEMMALATPGNKTLSMAVCGALGFGGAGAARLGASLLLGSGLLVESWQWAGLTLSRYQTLLLGYGLVAAAAAALLPLAPAMLPGRMRRPAKPTTTSSSPT